LGYLVYFVSPPKSWKFRFLSSPHFNIDKVNDNLFIIEYGNRVPNLSKSRFLVGINDRWLQKKLKNLANENSMIWQFDPFRIINPLLKRIYHVTDPFFTFKLNNIIATNSNLVVCTNENFEEHYNKLNNNVIHIPHGISQHSYRHTVEQVMALQKEYGKYAVFVGGIMFDTNLELFHEVAATEGINLVIIGKMELSAHEDLVSWNKLLNDSSVHYLGVKKYQELGDYIQASLIGLCPYKFPKDHEGGRSPLKILHYLAQGKNVICTIDSKIPELENQGIYRCQSVEEFNAVLTDCLKGKLIFNETAVSNYLSKHHYSELIKTIINHVDNE